MKFISCNVIFAPKSMLQQIIKTLQRLTTHSRFAVIDLDKLIYVLLAVNNECIFLHIEETETESWIRIWSVSPKNQFSLKK